MLQTSGLKRIKFCNAFGYDGNLHPDAWPLSRLHRETKGLFRTRVVLANVPSFLSFEFSFRGNM